MLEKSDALITYINFLQQVKEVQASNEFMKLSLIEERLLNLLATSWAVDQKITVLKALQINTEVSQSTSHRLLKGLRVKKFITLVMDEDDNRIKYVEPSDKANDYLKALGTCLYQARERQTA
jgi:DNA-binding MarR family transcriptional regulator